MRALIAVLLLSVAGFTSAAEGWYLLVPPLQFDKAPHVLDSRPLSEWLEVDAFDSADACTASQVAYIKVEAREARIKTPLLGPFYGYDQAMSSRCIASDDPRLLTPPKPR